MMQCNNYLPFYTKACIQHRFCSVEDLKAKLDSVKIYRYCQLTNIALVSDEIAHSNMLEYQLFQVKLSCSFARITMCVVTRCKMDNLSVKQKFAITNAVSFVMS